MQPVQPTEQCACISRRTFETDQTRGVSKELCRKNCVEDTEAAPRDCTRRNIWQPCCLCAASCCWAPGPLLVEWLAEVTLSTIPAPYEGLKASECDMHAFGSSRPHFTLKLRGLMQLRHLRSIANFTCFQAFNALELVLPACIVLQHCSPAIDLNEDLRSHPVACHMRDLWYGFCHSSAIEHRTFVLQSTHYTFQSYTISAD